MKYIKLFEDIKYKDLKKGDAVLITCSDIDAHEELFILSENPQKNSDGYTICAYRIIDDTSSLSFYDHEIVKKLKPSEIQLYTDLKKYNL